MPLTKSAWIVLLIVSLVAGSAVLVLLPLLPPYLEARRVKQSGNNLQAIAFALHQHQTLHFTFPSAGINPETHAHLLADWHVLGHQLSWRVRILPHLGQGELFERFHLDEPWNSPHNLSLLPEMPAVYRVPGHRHDQHCTAYLGIVDLENPDERLRTLMGPNSQIRPVHIQDGFAMTISVVEANEEFAVPWTKPSDYELNVENPGHGLGKSRRGLILAAFADNKVRRLPADIDAQTLVRLMFINDGMPVPMDRFPAFGHTDE